MPAVAELEPMTQSKSQAVAKTPKPKLNAYPWWAMRFWHGMLPADFFRLLKGGRFKLHPLRVPMAVIIAGVSGFNLALHLLQQVVFGRKIAETQLQHPPVFIVGHWRSGTTFLHELMVRDDRFAYPTTYQVFAPNHFLVSEPWVTRLFFFLIPKQRPMDNMAAGWQRPQEDEFALMVMGAHSPYTRMAFPNNPPRDSEYLNMEGVPEKDLENWKAKLKSYVKLLTYKYGGKQIIMKSPPHTGRIKYLAEMFPGAKFVHISRHPYSIYPSTCRLWPALDDAQGFQIPKNQQLVDYVHDCFDRMYSGYDAQYDSIDPDNIMDVRYEDLVADPVGVIENIYDTLELADYGNVREKIQAFADEQKDYRTNVHNMDDETKQEIRQRWSKYFTRYGYESD